MEVTLLACCLVALNVFLMARLWGLSEPAVQARWTAAITVIAGALFIYVATQFGDADLTPLGAISLGLVTLAAGMVLKAWR